MNGDARPRRLSPRAAALLLAAAAITLPAVYPLGDYVAARRNIRTLQSRVVEYDRRIAVLRTQLARLQTDAEVERLAREELGMVRPGEESFVIVDPPARPGESEPSPDR